MKLKKALFLALLTLSVTIAAELTILTNHIGYETGGSKRAVIRGITGDRIDSWILFRDGKPVLQGKPVWVGGVDRWKNWVFWTIDFTSVQESGEYVLECASGPGRFRSFPFRIEKNLLERHTLSNVLYYFKGQRCSGALDLADRNLPFEGGHGGRVDLHGGWYDATGDYGKHLSHLSFSHYHNPQQLSLTAYLLWLTLETLEERNDPTFRQYQRRLADEALFGADYLVRAKGPGGSFFRSVSAPGPGKRPEDRRLSCERRGFTIKTDADAANRNKSEDPGEQEIYEAGFRAGGGIAIAALACAARHSSGGDHSPAQYLQTAEVAYAWLADHNSELASDGRENIIDDYCALAAAIELWRTTGKSIYRDSARRRAGNLLDRLSGDTRYQNYWRADDRDRPFFHAADAGFPAVILAHYHRFAADDEKKPIETVLIRYFAFELEITGEMANPFGYARQYVQNKNGERRSSFFYPHDSDTSPWWQGENARLGSIAAAARLTAGILPKESTHARSLREHSTNQLNWILGLNPFDSCMLHGSGRNNPFYLFFGSTEYSNAPGGICNGITSGFRDEHEIDFNLPHTETGADHDWRWGEQWLPHATWYLYAMAQGNGDR